MSKNQHKIVTENFVREMNRIIREGQARNMTQVANECDYYIQGLSDITKGRRSVSVDLLHRFINKYNVDANLIFNTKENTNKFNEPDHIYKDQPPDKHLHELLRAKDKVIEAKESVIETQRELIQSLRESTALDEGKKRKAN